MTATDLILQWSIAAIVGLLLVARGRLTVFHPAAIYLAVHTVVFCLRPTLIVALDLEGTWGSMHLTPEPDLLRRALWVSSAGLVAFVAASLLGTAAAPALRPAAPPEMDRNDRRALLLIAAIFAVPGLASAAVADSVAAYSGYVRDVGLVLVPVALLAILAAQWRWWSVLPFIAVVGVRTASGGSASETVLVGIVLLLLLWLWSHQRMLPPFTVLAAGCVVAVGALLVADHRSSITDWLTGREVPNAPQGGEPGILDRLNRPGLAHFEALTHIVATIPDTSGAFSFGSQHLEAWMDDKPAASASARRGGGTFGSRDLTRHGAIRELPTPLVGDGWMSGGWTGLAITLALAGVLLGIAFVHFARHQDDPVAACFFMILQASSLGVYLTGNSTAVRGVAYTAVPLLAWRYLANRFRRTEAAETERERLREERQRRRLLGTALLNPHAAPLPPGVLPPVAAGPAVPQAAAGDAAPAERETDPTQLGAPETRAHPRARWRDHEPR